MARGFLLHSRPYRETSLIATFITDTDGRIDLMLRAARGRRRQNGLSSPLPFCLYELSWAGRGALKHLQLLEAVDAAINLSGQNLYCALYLNELLYRLLSHHEPESGLLQYYALALQQLAVTDDVEPVLRQFELTLLAELGYGMDFLSDETGEPLQAGQRYRFVPEKGLQRESIPLVGGELSAEAEIFLAIARRDFVRPEVRRLAKVILRTALAVYLGSKPLRSRELFLR